MSKFNDSQLVEVVEPKTTDEPFEEINETCSCGNKERCCSSEEVPLSSSEEHAEVISKKI